MNDLKPIMELDDTLRETYMAPINPPDKSWWPMCAKCRKMVDSIITIQTPNTSRIVKEYSVSCHGKHEKHMIGVWAAMQYASKGERLPDAFVKKTP